MAEEEGRPIRWIDAKREMMELNERCLKKWLEYYALAKSSGRDDYEWQECTREDTALLRESYKRLYAIAMAFKRAGFNQAVDKNRCAELPVRTVFEWWRDPNGFDLVTETRAGEFLNLSQRICRLWDDPADRYFAVCVWPCGFNRARWQLNWGLWEREHRRQYWDQLGHELLAERWHPRNAHRFADWGKG